MAASDKVILARDILDAVIRVRRTGVQTLLEQFEKEEPELAEITLEEITTIHRRLLDCGIPAKEARRIMHRTESLILVSLLAIRQAYRRAKSESPSPPIPSPSHHGLFLHSPTTSRSPGGNEVHRLHRRQVRFPGLGQR
jgi:hypothetical protein